MSFVLPSPTLLCAALLGGRFLGGLSPASPPAALPADPPARSRELLELEVARSVICPPYGAPAQPGDSWLPAAPLAAAGFGAGLFLGGCDGFLLGLVVASLACWLRTWAPRPSSHQAVPAIRQHPHLVIRGDQVQW